MKKPPAVRWLPRALHAPRCVRETVSTERIRSRRQPGKVARSGDIVARHATLVKGEFVGEAVTKAAAARAMGVTPQRMGDLVAEGKIGQRPDGLLDLDVVERYFATMDPADRAKGGKEAPQEDKRRIQEQDARIADRVYRAKERELIYKTKAGLLVPKAEVEELARTAAKKFSAYAENFPRSVAPLVVGKTEAQIRDVLEKRLSQMIEEIRGDFGHELGTAVSS